MYGLIFVVNFTGIQVHRMTDKVYVGLAGFNSDAKTVLDKIVFRKTLYELKENRKIKPEVCRIILPSFICDHNKEIINGML